MKSMLGGGGAKLLGNQADRILLKRASEENVITDNLQADSVLHGELILSLEKDKEKLYTKNSNNEIVQIHRVANAGEIEYTPPVQEPFTIHSDVEGANVYFNNDTLIGTIQEGKLDTDFGVVSVGGTITLSGGTMPTKESVYTFEATAIEDKKVPSSGATITISDYANVTSNKVVYNYQLPTNGYTIVDGDTGCTLNAVESTDTVEVSYQPTTSMIDANTGYTELSTAITITQDESDKQLQVTLIIEALNGVYTPEEAPNNVYVYANDGLLYVPEVWETGRNDEAVGVAVVTDNTRLCVKKGIDAKNNIRWSNRIFDVSEVSTSYYDYRGLNNSIAIREATPSESNTNNAAWYCYSQTINVNGNTINGYLPGYGELSDLYNNKVLLENSLNLIRSINISDYCTNNNSKLMSSTEAVNNQREGFVSLFWGYGGDSIDYKEFAYENKYALPVFPLLPTLVDLGLPSGTLWAATNLNAFKPEQGGYYYQWGDTIGWTKEQVGVDKQFASNFSDYKFGTSGNFTKYNDSDSKTELDLGDDVVNVIFNGNWVIPTYEDLIELVNNTTNEWVTVNGINGKKFISSNGNYIFIPASGFALDGSLNYDGSDGYVWSSSLHSIGGNNSFAYVFDEDKSITDLNYSRYYGLSIRPVYKPKTMEMVDLGLPSGNKWAKCNLGANSEEESGLYFQWGDTKGWTKEQIGVDKVFDWANYKWSIDGSSSNLSKYNSSDNKTVLDLEDDAVYVALGGNWKMPTYEDWQELYNNTERQWTQVNGVNGYKCTASNGNYIFLPAAGSCSGSSLNYEGSNSNFWTSSLSSVGPGNAFSCYFSSSWFSPDLSYTRYNGFSVRGIYKSE